MSDNCIIKNNLNYFILKGIKCSVNEPFYILKIYALNSEKQTLGIFFSVTWKTKCILILQTSVFGTNYPLASLGGTCAIYHSKVSHSQF